MKPERQRSNWWYLLPIVHDILGGIIAYFAIKNDDREKAKKCLFLGLVLFSVKIAIGLLIVALEIPIEEQFDVNV